MKTTKGALFSVCWRAWCVMIVVALLAVSACGSTVQRDAGGVAPSLEATVAEKDAFGEQTPRDETGTAAGPHEAGTGTPAPTSPGAVSNGTTDPEREANAGAPSSDRPRSGGPGSDGPSPVGRGITDDEILIGITWYDMEAVARGDAILGGGDGGAPGGQGGKSVPQAVVDYINDHGGIAGRKIVPIYHEINAAAVLTKEGRAREAQRMCARFTEDAEVFAVALAHGWSDEIVTCAVKARTPHVAPDAQYVDEKWAAEIGPFLYVPTGFTVERRERTMVERLAAQGFFDGDAKVGLLIDGTSPAFKKGADRALKPALAKLGVEVAREVVYPDWFNSPWANYVLQFQSAGVTHVIWGAGYSSPLLFMRAAENQQYRPLYGGIGSDRLPAEVAEDAPVEQLRRVTAFGWQPFKDLSTDSGPITARDAECRGLMEEAGQQIERPGQSEWFADGYCDTLFFLRDGLNSAPALTPEGMASAVGAFGTSWESTISWSTRFSPGRYAGADTVRDLAYRPGCSCFEYTTQRIKAP